MPNAEKIIRLAMDYTSRDAAITMARQHGCSKSDIASAVAKIEREISEMKHELEALQARGWQ